MKIAVLSRNPSLYSTRRLVEAASERDHEVMVIDPLRCYMTIASQRPTMHYRGEELTGFARTTKDIGDLIQMVGGAPLVVKLLEGTQGIGVVLADTEKTGETLIEAFRGLKAHILVQEFIKEAKGADIRCFVVGDKVIAAMKRQGAEGEFRSNIHRGGKASVVRLTPEERSTAVRSARIMGLNVAGVDILRSNHGPVVMEVNSSPGLEGIEQATGKDVAGQIVQFIEKQAVPGKTKTRGKG